MNPRVRRWVGLAAGIAAVLILVLLLLPAIARGIIRSRLQTIVSDQLNATLRIDHLAYAPPYGVTLRGASLMAWEPDGKPLELLRVARLDLKLATLPLGRGPLVISSVIIDDPAIHLIKGADGLAGRKLLKPTANTVATPAQPDRLSDHFRLTRLALHNGQFIYEDRANPAAVPMVWRNINVDLNLSQQSAADYGYHLVIDNAQIASIDAIGTADIDQLILRIDQCALSVNVDPGRKESALSSELQKPLHEWNAKGTLALGLKGTVPLRDLAHSVYDLTLDFAVTGARIPGWQTALDRVALNMELTDGSEQPVAGRAPGAAGERPTARLRLIEAVAGDAQLRVQDALAIADTHARTWSLSGLRGHIDPGHWRQGFPPAVRKFLDSLTGAGTIDFELDAAGPQSGQVNKWVARLGLLPRDLVVQPAGVNQPISGIAPLVVTLADGVAVTEGIRGECGGNLLFVKRARIDLNDLPRRVRVTDLSGCLTLGPGQKYPVQAVEGVLSECKPVGPFFFGGTVTADPRRPRETLDYNLQVHTTRGRLSVTDHQIPLTNIDTTIDLTPAAATIGHFEASALDGAASVTGRLALRDMKPYQIEATLRDVDLNELGRYLAHPGEPPTPLSGRAVMTAKLAGVLPRGSAPAWEGLRGNGEFEVREGNFWRIPLMRSISQSLPVQRATTIGEAAGRFQIHDDVIHFDQALATAPALGVEGSGELAFDGRMSFKLIADVLGRWSERVGDVGDGGAVATLLGKVQQGVNVATQQALYQVDVTGTVSNPRTTAVAAPFLTKQVGNLLGAALDRSRKTGLLTALHNDQSVATTQSAAR